METISDRKGNVYRVIESARWTVTVRGSEPRRHVTVLDSRGKRLTVWADTNVTALVQGTVDKRSCFGV